MSIETENDTLWLWALINCHLPSPASIQSSTIEGACIGTVNFLTENSLVTTPFYILLNKSATLLDTTFKSRKCHCCNNQKPLFSPLFVSF